MKIITSLELRRIFRGYSIRVRILFPYIIVYSITRDDLCRIIRDDFQSFGKGCRMIRRAEFLKVR